MWKDIRQLCVKLIALLLPFFVLLPLYCRFFPMYYMDDEYAMYVQQNDYVTGKLNNENAVTATHGDNRASDRVLILGDSRAKAGFQPAKLWEGSYNIALGGASPIEGYYGLKKYLANHEKPRTVIMAYAPMHYMDVDTLWTRSIYFHTLSPEDFRDLVRNAANFQDTEKILIENYNVEYLMHYFYMPNKYATALKKSAFVLRHEKTVQKYNDMVAYKGHSFYGTAEYSDGVNGEAKVTDFAASDIITWYLEETFALCRENGIQVILEQTPMNETSYGILTEDFKNHFRSYMYDLAANNPDVTVFPDFLCYPNDCFGDADHLNEKGVSVYCGYMMEKYPGL